LTVIPFDEPISEYSVEYKDVTQVLIEQLSLPPADRRNLIAVTGTRISLAGAQNKLPVVPRDGMYLVPADYSFAATTHIIMVPSGGFRDVQCNEAFCMNLAKATGLPEANTQIIDIAGSDAILVERYDRTIVDGTAYLLHQEDFCQVAGIPGMRKYEDEGGGPGFSACAGFIRRCNAAADSIDDFAKLAIFNYIIGNCVAHAKNFSLLFERVPELGIIDPGVRLAPFYDLMSVPPYYNCDLDDRMAMRYGNVYKHADINADSFVALAHDLGIDVPGFVTSIREYCAKLSSKVHEIAELHIRKYPNATIYPEYYR
jgi:serine/threonine-protein kinase HipA